MDRFNHLFSLCILSLTMSHLSGMMSLPAALQHNTIFNLSTRVPLMSRLIKQQQNKLPATQSKQSSLTSGDTVKTSSWYESLIKSCTQHKDHKEEKREQYSDGQKKNSRSTWWAWAFGAGAATCASAYAAAKLCGHNDNDNNDEDIMTIQDAYKAVKKIYNLPEVCLDDVDAKTVYRIFKFLFKNIDHTDSETLKQCLCALSLHGKDGEFIAKVCQHISTYCQRQTTFKAFTLNFLCQCLQDRSTIPTKKDKNGFVKIFQQILACLQGQAIFRTTVFNPNFAPSLDFLRPYLPGSAEQELIKTKLESFFISPQFDWSNFDHIAQLVVYRQWFGQSNPPLKPYSKPLSATASQMLHSNTADISLFANSYINNKHNFVLVKNLIKRELYYQEKGFTTFVHAQENQWNLFLNWYKRLYKIHHNVKCPKNFLFPHILAEQPAEQSRQERLKLVQNGLPQADWELDIYERLVLFTNYALFANAGGCNSSWYLYSNQSVAQYKESAWPKRIFSTLGYKDIYPTYKAQMSRIYRQHQNLFDKYSSAACGNLLLIAIPNAQVNEIAYIARPGGFKDSFYSQDKPVGEPLQALTLLQNNPSAITTHNNDQLFFCLVPTYDIVNPQGTIKVEEFNVLKAHEDRVIKQASNKLFKEVADTIQIRRNPWHKKFEQMRPFFDI